MKVLIYSPIKNKEFQRFQDPHSITNIDDLGLHLTWFGLEINEENKTDLDKIALQIASKYLPFEMKVKDVTTTSYGVTRANMMQTPEIQALHEEIIKQSVKFRNPSLPSKAKKFYNEFSNVEKTLIDKYGRANILENFVPHISLGRLGEDVQIDQKLSFKSGINLNSLKVYYSSN